MKIRYKKSGKRTQTCAHIDFHKQEIVLRYSNKHCPLNEEERAICLIEHEIMHDILYNLFNFDVSKKWDHICDRVANHIPDVYC